MEDPLIKVYTGKPMAITIETIPKNTLIEERFCLGCKDRNLFIILGFGF